MNDTNTVELLKWLLVQKAVSPVSDFWIQLVPALAAALFAAAGYLKAVTAVQNTERLKVSSEATAVSLEKAHIAINSERSATLEEIRQLKSEVLKLSEKIAFSEGRKEIETQELLTAAVVAAAKKVQDNANQPNSN